MTATDAIDRLRSVLATAVDDRAIEAIDGRAIALGWATVELERATHELDAALGLPPGRFTPAAPTPTLGAICCVARDALSSGLALVLLEPSTEGRLAGWLARHGEGPAAVWLAVGDVSAAVAALHGAGVMTSAERPGPLGPERLFLDGPIDGLPRLVVERAGTIRA